MFTRQQYKAIAKIIRWGVDEEENAKGCGIAVKMAGKLADYFIADNERFNRKKFADACIPENLNFIEGTGQTVKEYFDI